jgi:hypothetical protein
MTERRTKNGKKKGLGGGKKKRGKGMTKETQMMIYTGNFAAWYIFRYLFFFALK